MGQQSIAAKEYRFDPRTRLAVVLGLSTLSVFINDVVWLCGLLVVTLFAALLLGGSIMPVLRRSGWMLGMFVIFVFAQSIFSSADTALVSIGKVTLISRYGIEAAALFFFRIVIVVFSATILMQENSRRMICALSQMHCPYELAFMVATAVRFLSLIRGEFTDSMHAVQMRGADFKHIPISKRVTVYTYILLPVMVGALMRARQLSVSLDMRGFRRDKKRTAYFTLTMDTRDKIIIAVSLILAAAVLCAYYLTR